MSRPRTAIVVALAALVAAGIASASQLGVRLSAKHVRAGRQVTVRLTGPPAARARLCVLAPAAARSCRSVTVPFRQRRRAARPGRWLIGARLPGGRRVRRRLRVLPHAGGLRVLATGDSMIQIVDSFLKRRLRARVRSDAHVSSGISKPGMLDWVRHARRQAAGRPDVTIVFIGANDGFPIGSAACCGEAWVRAYASRVRRMMRAYKRGRAGVIYWLTLPTPRDARFARVFGPVNTALKRASSSFGGQVRLLDLRRTFTPDRRFHRVIRYRGRRVVARQGDGVHLSTAGASIAASIVIRAMRRDRIL